MKDCHEPTKNNRSRNDKTASGCRDQIHLRFDLGYNEKNERRKMDVQREPRLKNDGVEPGQAVGPISSTKLNRNFVTIDLEKYSGAMEEAPPASEILATYFIFAMSGINLPKNEQEKKDFITSFAIDKFTGNFGAESTNISPAARTLMMSTSDARCQYLNTLRASEAARKERLDKGELHVDNVENYISHEEEKDFFEGAREEIKQHLESLGLDDEEVKFYTFEITKEISFLLVQSLIADDKTGNEIEILNKLLAEGKHEEVFIEFQELVGNAETEQLLGKVKDQVILEWEHKLFGNHKSKEV